MKMQKSVILVRKNLKLNMLKIKNILKLGKIVIIQVNIEVLHKTCNWKYSVPNKIPITFHNLSMIIVLL